MMPVHSVFRGMLAAGLLSFASGALADSVIIKHPLANVTSDEFAQVIEHLVPDDALLAMRSKEKNMRGFLADYFTYKMMAEAALQKKLDADPAIGFKLAHYRDRMLTEALIKDYQDKAKRPNFKKLAKESYKAEPEKFMRPETVKAEHILVAVGPERTEEQAKVRANEVLQKVRNSTDAFADLAREYSDDPSAARNGGNLGFFQRERMVPEFSETAFSMKVGAVSEPVKTQFGYHIIHVLDKKTAGKVPFEQVEKRLIAELEKEFLNEKRDEIVKQFRGSKEIELDQEVLAEFIEAMQSMVRQPGQADKAK